MDASIIFVVISLLLILTFSGVMVSYLTSLEYVFDNSNRDQYLHIMENVIEQGRSSPAVGVIVILPILTLGLAIFLSFSELLDTVLLSVTLLLFLTGGLLVSVLHTEKIYDDILEIDENDDWKVLQSRWTQSNIYRFLLTFSSALFASLALIF